MAEQDFGKAYGGHPPANYERFFVPAIGAPLATDLVRLASLRPGERVLDVACGTGVVAPLTSQEVGATGINVEQVNCAASKIHILLSDSAQK